jgi:hypothetical protein
MYTRADFLSAHCVNNFFRLRLYTTDDIKCYQIELTPGFNSELKVESFLFAAYLDNWFRVESAEICAVRGFPL